MGLKKIEELRKQLRAKTDSLDKFKKAADEFVQAYNKIRDSYDKVEKLRNDNLAKVEAIDALGVPEFEAYKRNLVTVYNGWSTRPLPTKPLDVVISKQISELNDAVLARIAKLASIFPKTLKAGMVFKRDLGGKLFELKGEARESTNVNLKGDGKIFWDTVDTEGKSGSVSVAELKKGHKYINA